jgi:hypothetical protein
VSVDSQIASIRRPRLRTVTLEEADRRYERRGSAAGGATDLGYTASTRQLTSSTGADVTLPLAAGEAGLMSAADKAKLDGVATGATANAADASLRDRATHTGTQAIATVSGLQAALDGKAGTSHTHAVSDVTGLEAALDGKAAASHTHTATAISDSTAAGRAMLMAADAAAQTQLLTTFASGTKGLVPASGGGTVNFLRADGTWGPASGGGSTPYYGVLQSNFTLASQTAAQRLFNWSANGALTLPTGIYRFETMLYLLSMSATSGNGAFQLRGAGTATLARILFLTQGIDNSSPLNAGTRTGSAAVTQNSPASMVTATTGTGMVSHIVGSFDVTVTGTIIPSIALVTAAAAIVQAGSFFVCERLGNTAAAASSGWS